MTGIRPLLTPSKCSSEVDVVADDLWERRGLAVKSCIPSNASTLPVCLYGKPLPSPIMELCKY